MIDLQNDTILHNDNIGQHNILPSIYQKYELIVLISSEFIFFTCQFAE